MMKNMDKKAFTLIELLVVIAVVGILVLLAAPRFTGYTQKAEDARIQHDIKVMEQEVGTMLINGDDDFNEWENNINDLNQLAQDDELFEKEGRVAKAGDPIDGTYKVIPKEYKGKINTKLKGTFYANSHGKVYYEHGQGPGYSDEELDDLFKNHDFIPVATADELNNVRSVTLETYGKGTKWEGKYTGGLDKKYVQVKDIGLSEYSGGEGWEPIGSYTSWSNKSPFIGEFDGNGYKITGLTINRHETDYVGLFRYTKKATISNVALEDVDVTGKEAVGGLVGYATDKTTISNSYATGSVTGTRTGIRGSAGGLVGSASTDGTGYGPTISNSYFTGSVIGGYNVGGLVGLVEMATISNSYAEGSVESTSNQVGGLLGRASNSTIENSYATGSVTGRTYVGGLVGHTSYITTISNSSFTGSVEGTSSYTTVGGLVGEAYSSNIENSYAKGTVTGTAGYVGGLMGYANYSDISNSYFTGSVKGSGTGLYSGVGGLVGQAYDSDVTINDSYATGSVTGGDHVGGLVGQAYPSTSKLTISNSYWNKETTGQSESARQETSFGKTTDEMKKQETYEGWVFDTIWTIQEGVSYPTLINNPERH